MKNNTKSIIGFQSIQHHFIKFESSLILVLFFLLLSFPGVSQYSINGKIEDANHSGVPFANVLLLNKTDSALIKGAVTDGEGHYTLSKVSSGNYFIESYMIGYAKSYTSEIKFGAQQELTLENIILSVDTRKLDEVVIKADKPLYEMEMGKMIVNVQSSITSSGQSVIDVLEKSPGILVNRQSNTFSLGGKDGVIVLMNGKRSRMPMEAVYQMLEGLNAGDIDKIEIMTVPPAKYDADGDAGFINIVMKKAAGVGTNCTVMTNLGYGSGPIVAASLNLSHQAKKFSLFGNYSYNSVTAEQLLNMNRETTTDTQNTISSSESDREANPISHNYRFGMDYFLSSNTIVGGLISGYDSQFKINSYTHSFFDYSVSPDTLVEMERQGNNHWRNLMGNINIQHTFEKGQVLNANLDYLWYDNDNPGYYINDYYDEEGMFLRREENRLSKLTPINMWVAKLDYAMHIGGSVTFESGIKGTWSDLINDVVFEEKKEDDWFVNESYSNYAELTEDILAAFSSLKIEINEHTNLNAGLRFEHTTTKLNTLDEVGVVDRKYGDFFPTLYLARKINDNNLIQFSYGRRITRPTFNDMSPFVLLIDPYTIYTGNTDILPAYTNSIKTDYAYKSLIVLLQYSHDKNAILRHQLQLNPETNIMYIIGDNIDRRETLSSTITMPFGITDWWEMQNNFSANWQLIETEMDEGMYSRSQYGYQINTTQTFRLPKKVTLELSGFYISPVIIGYVNKLSKSFVNFGIQKEFDNDMTLRLACNDIFEKNQTRRETDDSAPFYYSMLYKPDKRIFTLSYTRKFGNKKIKGERKRSVGSAAEQKRVKKN